MSKLSLCAILLMGALGMGIAASGADSNQPAGATPQKIESSQFSFKTNCDFGPNSYTESIAGTLVTFEMVPIPAGGITLPDPAKKGATKTIKVGPLWIGKTEVTWDAYDIFVFRLDEPRDAKPLGRDATSHPSKPYGAADRGYGHKGYPAINESFLGAQTYCKWLSKKTGHSYRLPTEAEWQYACLAGAPAPTAEQLKTSAVTFAEKPSPVASKQPNAWGLFDMLGNVAEWCVDLKGKPVVCGGSFEDSPKKVSPSMRKYQTETWQENDPQDPKSKWWLSDGQFVGFRIVRDCAQATKAK